MKRVLVPPHIVVFTTFSNGIDWQQVRKIFIISHPTGHRNGHGMAVVKFSQSLGEHQALHGIMVE
jgi:hypothetical protein